jgi:hypothetical protein
MGSKINMSQTTVRTLDFWAESRFSDVLFLLFLEIRWQAREVVETALAPPKQLD